MSRENHPEHLGELFEKLIDNNLTDTESAELERLLTQTENKRKYLSFMEIHVRLARLLSSSRRTASPRAFEAIKKTAPLLPEESGSDWQMPYFSMFFLAALLALMVVGWNWYTTWVAPDFTAKIVNKIDCDLELSRWNSNANDVLQPGQIISVKRGLLSLEFGCGATVALEGPADFQIVSKERGFLHFGKLTANAPDRAKGFTIETPTCRSVDLGTEFGMVVDVSGASETHVFEGEVLVYENDVADNKATSTNALRLKVNQASRVTDDLKTAVEFQASPMAFLRLPKKIQTSFVKTESVFDQDESPIIWYDASKHIQTDEFLRVVSWLDLTGDGTQESENAWQVDSDRRPYLIRDAIHGHPAVRFVANENLVTEPVSVGNQISIFVVVKMLPQRLRKGRQAVFFSFDSPLGIRLFRNPQNQLVSKKPGYWKNGVEKYSAWNSLKYDFDQVPVVLSLVYDRDTNRSTLMANGNITSSGNAHAAIACDKPFLLGCSNDRQDAFAGDIAEILVFNSALAAPAQKRVTHWLMEKYSIEALAPGDLEVSAAPQVAE